MKLNTTGTLIQNFDGTIWSYDTPIYREFRLQNGTLLKVFNDTYYTATTRKHQSIIGKYRHIADIIFYNCPYGYWSLDTAFKNEIIMIEDKIEELQNKTRKLGKRQAERLNNLKDRLQVVQKLYSKI